MTTLYTGGYRLTPGGERDTYTTHRMRAELKRENPMDAAAAKWATLPLTLKARWIAAAMHCGGIEAMGRAECPWLDLTPRERIMIGAAARREAGALGGPQ